MTSQRGDGDDGIGWLLGMALVAIRIAVVYGLASWWFTRYAIVDDDLRVETGLIFRRSRVVDLDIVRLASGAARRIGKESVKRVLAVFDRGGARLG